MEAPEYLKKVQVGTLGGQGCPECADAVLARKVRMFPRKEMPDGARAAGEQSLMKAFEVGAACLVAKGGSESTLIEMIFSLFRMIGPVSLKYSVR